jgi:hypothetical protein
MSKTIRDTFTASEAAHLIDVKVDTLRVWRRRGHFEVEGEGEGWTRFTFSDVLTIATFRTLIGNSLEIELAESIAGNASEKFAAVFASARTMENLDDVRLPYLVFGGSASGPFMHLAKGAEDAARILLRSIANGKNPVLHVLDYGSILAAVLNRLNALNKG